MTSRSGAPADDVRARYARCFELPEHVIEAGRNASVCVVHHDADGRIASVECR